MSHIGFIKRANCELCGSRNKEILISKNYTDDRVWGFIDRYYEGRIRQDWFKDVMYEVVKCKECTFIWQVYVLNEYGINKLYEDWISKSESLEKKIHATASLYIRYAEEIKTIIKLINKNPHEIKTLDYGMGWGYWCLMAKAFNLNVKGYEVSDTRLSYAKSNCIEVIENNENLNNYKFDFINTNHVFEHIITPAVVYDKLVNLLNPGGIIRISVPYGKHMEHKLKKSNWKASKDALHPLEHINCFTQKTLIKMGERNNMKAIKGINLIYIMKCILKINNDFYFIKI